MVKECSVYLYWLITSLAQSRLMSDTSVGMVVTLPDCGLRAISDIFLQNRTVCNCIFLIHLNYVWSICYIKLVTIKGIYFFIMKWADFESSNVKQGKMCIVRTLTFILSVSYITANLYFICLSTVSCTLEQMQYRFLVIYGPPCTLKNVRTNIYEIIGP